jgi:hypothetical protein
VYCIVFVAQVCAHGDAAEMPIPIFNEVSPLRMAHVLNLRMTDAPDCIYRMLSVRLCKMVNEFLGRLDLSGVRGTVSASASNRLGANAELSPPMLDLRALPPPHLVSSLLLTGPLPIASLSRRFPLAGAAVSGSDHLSAASSSAMVDSALDNYIAAHADRHKLPPLPVAPVADGERGSVYA